MVFETIVLSAGAGCFLGALLTERRTRRKMQEARDSASKTLLEAGDAYRDARREREEARRWVESGIKLGLVSQSSEEGKEL